MIFEGEDDAMYSCGLCCCDSTAASMFAHVKGFKHREKYLGMKYNLTTDDKKTVLYEAKVIQEKLKSYFYLEVNCYIILINSLGNTLNIDTQSFLYF